MVYKTGIVREKEVELMIRVHFIPGKQQSQFIRQGSTWSFRWLCSLVTNLREYLAVQNLHLFPIHKTILDPQSTLKALPEHLIRNASTFFKKNLDLNESQAQAVATSLLDPNPFTLIQGPPGTGKTKTIEGLLSAIFSGSSFGNPITFHYDRVLICAPSNAAIDEIVRRIKDGIRDIGGNRIPLRVIRIGSYDAMHEQVKDVSIERLVEKRLEEQIGEALKLMECQKNQIKELRHALDTCGSENMTRQSDLKSQLWQAREDSRKSINFVEETRQSIKQKLLTTSHVICTTLSGAGHELLSRAELDFKMVIIDEACQSVEPSSLIPLQYNCQKCILVGDPNQLPPTIKSQSAVRLIYDQSLFKRLQKFIPVQLLNVQYRMHSEISRFPSRYFYLDVLKDAPDMLMKCDRSWHGIDALGPYKFFDIPGMEQSGTSRSGHATNSLQNKSEGKTAVTLVVLLCSATPNENLFGRIAIITPYKEQRRKIKKELLNRFGEASASGVEVGTVDGFQGQEREIIILSCVRTGETRNGIGFLNDARRMNVALTRAKCSLYILGNSSALIKNSLWNALIQDAKMRNLFIPYEKSTWECHKHTRPTNLIGMRSSLVTSPSRNDRVFDDREPIDVMTNRTGIKRRHQ